jgi:hypothetical protein
MTKTINTLVDDIHTVLREGVEVPDEVVNSFATSMALMLKERLAPRKERVGTLRMSAMGKPDRQLWYEVNEKPKALPLEQNAYMKFLIGDITEEVLIMLTKLSGHTVTGEQDELMIEGIKGHRDLVIDGMTVDTKSASEFGFKKFEEGLKPEQDGFGYLAQINAYIEAAEDDPLVTIKDKGAFLVLQKVTGDITLDVHEKTKDMSTQYKRQIEMVAGDIPERCLEPVPDGYTKYNKDKTKTFMPNGNMKLPTFCGYCAFKHECHDNIRTFQGKGYPKFFTKIVKEPKMMEVK